MLRFIMKLIKRKRIKTNILTEISDITPIKESETIMKIIKPNITPGCTSALDTTEK